MTSRQSERPGRQKASPFLTRRLRRCWSALLVLVACWSSFVPVRAEPAAAPSEYQVKAVFLLNFLKYVEWPATAHAGANTPLQIGHIGKDRFGANLSSLVESKSIEGRHVLLKYSDAQNDWRQSHVLFISNSEQRRLPEILAAVKDAPVLTVGETEDFLEQGGMINFVVKGKNVRIEINLVAAEAAGLKLSSRLLAIADVVRRK
jgi:hypothetical protein